MQPDELKDARQGLGLSQAELAKVLGLSGNFISMMERGDKAIEPRTELAVNYLIDIQDTRRILTMLDNGEMATHSTSGGGTLHDTTEETKALFQTKVQRLERALVRIMKD